MSIRNFQVRKYSFLKEQHWEHFPSRNDISLTVVNRATLKVIWKSTVMEELQVHINDVSAYSKCPSIGFKYYALGDLVHKRFQVSFSSAQEHQQCLSYLQNECDLVVSDTSMSNAIVAPTPSSIADTSLAITQSQQLFPQLSQQMLIIPDSQFAVPMTTQPYHHHQRQYTQIPIQQQQQHHQHHLFPLTQPSPSQPSISQPTLTQVPSISNSTYQQQQQNLDHMDFLSQILEPDKDTPAPSPSHDVPAASTAMSMDQLDKMSDEEIKELLKEKIKDVGFINFVERLESCLKGMQ